MSNKFDIHEQLIQKWDPFLVGLESNYKKNLVAVLMENVQKYLDSVREQGDEPVGKFAKYALPLVRRITQDLSAADLVSVQPLAVPDGKVFYMDFIYKNTYGTITDTNNVADYVDPTYTQTGMNTKGATARKVRLSFTSAGVTTTSKKLVGDMFVEDEQDLMTYYGISGEDELMKAMSFQIIRELNNYIIKDLLDGATAGNVNFDCNIPTTGKYATYIDDRLYQKKLYDSIIDADAAIFSKRYVTSNWIVAGGAACALLEKAGSDFVTDNNPNVNQQEVGLYRFGTYKGRWKVYKYAFMPDTTKLLVGYKGGTEFNAGYVFAPYIPAYATPVWIDPQTMIKSRGFMARTAEKLISGDYYATVTLQNL